MKHQAIYCDSEFGPYFGGDIAVYDNCNAHTGSFTSFGTSYTNDTGLGDTVVDEIHSEGPARLREA
jgi:hypothetical protein